MHVCMLTHTHVHTHLCTCTLISVPQSAPLMNHKINAWMGLFRLQTDSRIQISFRKQQKCKFRGILTVILFFCLSFRIQTLTLSHPCKCYLAEVPHFDVTHHRNANIVMHSADILKLPNISWKHVIVILHSYIIILTLLDFGFVSRSQMVYICQQQHHTGAISFIFHI